MVDISGKGETERMAVAEGKICLKPETISAIKEKKIQKGDVFSAASLAVMHWVKRTSELLFHCHPVPINWVNSEFSFDPDGVRVRVTVKGVAKTGLEMEALVGTCAALVTIWDMVKALEKDEEGQYPKTEITSIKVLHKLKR